MAALMAWLPSPQPWLSPCHPDPAPAKLSVDHRIPSTCSVPDKWPLLPGPGKCVLGAHMDEPSGPWETSLSALELRAGPTSRPCTPTGPLHGLCCAGPRQRLCRLLWAPGMEGCLALPTRTPVPAEDPMCSLPGGSWRKGKATDGFTKELWIELLDCPGRRESRGRGGASPGVGVGCAQR